MVVLGTVVLPLSSRRPPACAQPAHDPPPHNNHRSLRTDPRSNHNNTNPEQQPTPPSTAKTHPTPTPRNSRTVECWNRSGPNSDTWRDRACFRG
ncbi:MAG: hypothetical protein K0U59_12545 [Gammaproteobacteria bacterium]|nr:hypothetical protein [Gammaproteobacteria bacterium]